MRFSAGLLTGFVGCSLTVGVVLAACGDSGGGSSTVVPTADASDVGTGVEGSIIPDATGEVAAPKPLFATKLGAGTEHACTVRSDGTVACWGHNTAYQLGVEDAGGAFTSTPVHATQLTGAVSVFGTFATGCALLDTAELGCWGSNSGGLLGKITAPSFSAVPVHVGDLTDVVAATGGERHACLLRAGGRPFCWGDNNDEQLGAGIPGVEGSAAPAPVADLLNVKYIGSGAASSHTCAIRDDDQVMCWGLNNATGQLGAPTFDEAKSPTPLLVDNVQDAVKVATGRDHSCAILKGGGAVRCWGANEDGQVGFGLPFVGATEKTAKDVPGINDAVALSLGDKVTCIVHATGKASCWGLNANGALGAGNADAGVSTVTPVDVAGITDAVDIALGVGFGCVLRNGGKVSCWGVNDKGQLGSGAVDAGVFSATPVEVSGL